MRRPRRFVVLAVGLVCASAAAGCVTTTRPTANLTSAHARTTAASPSSPSPSPTRTPTPSPTVSIQGIDRAEAFGKSVRDVPLRLVELGDPRRPGLLVVGCIHGDEAAGVAVVNALLADAATTRAHLWLVATLNPDGELANRRTNADGVDLNRNFPYRWQPLQHPGETNYSGVGPLSEPESQAMAALLRRIRPAVGVWFHQSLNVIDISQGPRAIEDQLAAALHVKEMSLSDYPGSAIGFEDSLIPDSAFAFELPRGGLSSSRAKQIADAIVTVAASL